MHRNARMRRLKFILDHQTVCQSLVDLEIPQTSCFEPPSRGRRSLRARAERRGGATPSPNGQAGHGSIESLPMVSWEAARSFKLNKSCVVACHAVNRLLLGVSYFLSGA